MVRVFSAVLSARAGELDLEKALNHIESAGFGIISALPVPSGKRSGQVTYRIIARPVADVASPNCSGGESGSGLSRG